MFAERDPLKNVSLLLLETCEKNIGEMNEWLTLYGPNSFFRRFSGHNLR